jgi:hypothetical protein
MVKTLLQRVAELKSDENIRSFLNYIIAASHRKMNSRMKNPMSISYYDCLLKWKSHMVLEFPSQEAKAIDKRRDRPFIESISDLAEYAHTKIPNLHRVAKQQQQQPIELYNESTYLEFHALLCELLKRFKTSLEKLEKLASFQTQKKVAVEDILKRLVKVQVLGHYLRTMVRSSVIEAHLQTIAPYLSVDIHKSWTPDSDEEADPTEFLALKPYSLRKGKPLLPWESYRDWLMLMVHYFDAAFVLVDHVSKWNDATISLSILSPPLPDGAMLPWTEILENFRFFPTEPTESSGEDFIKFLKEKVSDKNDVSNPIYAALRNGPLSKADFKGKYHCEAYIASLLTFEEHSDANVDDFVEGLREIVSTEDETKNIEKLMGEIKVSRFFMHHFNLC